MNLDRFQPPSEREYLTGSHTGSARGECDECGYKGPHHEHCSHASESDIRYHQRRKCPCGCGNTSVWHARKGAS